MKEANFYKLSKEEKITIATTLGNIPWKVINDTGGTWIEDSKGNTVLKVFNKHIHNANVISALPVCLKTLLGIVVSINEIEGVRALKGTEISIREAAILAIEEATR